jgi:hypothetical protein
MEDSTWALTPVPKMFWRTVAGSLPKKSTRSIRWSSRSYFSGPMMKGRKDLRFR